MEEAAAVRRAARGAVDDVEPDRLRSRIEDRLDAASVTPGVLTLVSARAVRDESVEGIAERAAGVQLIYEGLGLTRSLARDDPWAASDVKPAESGDAGARDAPEDAVEHGSTSPDSQARQDAGGTRSAEPSVADAPEDADEQRSPSPGSQTRRDAADLDILIADILVSRGFYLLARTEAAEAAVDVVRAFGTDQTVRRQTDDDSLDGELESDVLELAVVAGTTAVSGRATVRLREYVTDLAGDGLPSVERVTGADVLDSLGRFAGTEPLASDEVRTSADH